MNVGRTVADWIRRSQDEQVFTATVTGIDGEKVFILRPGAAVQDPTSYPRLGAYESPAVGDTVLVVVSRRTPIVVSKVADAPIATSARGVLQCRLLRAGVEGSGDGEGIFLGAHNGNALWIDGVIRTVPAKDAYWAGGAYLLCDNGSGGDGALGLYGTWTYYFVYAYWNASTGQINLEASTTAFIWNAYGIPVKTGDPSRTLVGAFTSDENNVILANDGRHVGTVSAHQQAWQYFSDGGNTAGTDVSSATPVDIGPNNYTPPYGPPDYKGFCAVANLVMATGTFALGAEGDGSCDTGGATIRLETGDVNGYSGASGWASSVTATVAVANYRVNMTKFTFANNTTNGLFKYTLWAATSAGNAKFYVVPQGAVLG